MKRSYVTRFSLLGKEEDIMTLVDIASEFYGVPVIHIDKNILKLWFLQKSDLEEFNNAIG